MIQLTSAGLALLSERVVAEESMPLSASWTNTDAVPDLTSFNEDLYRAVTDDTRRTPQYIKAIKQRVAGQEGKLVVLDIETGPFALLALVAARAGAKKVYAIEPNPEAARRARDFVSKQEDIENGVVEVLEGLSTNIKLPEKVDLVIAENVGALASEGTLIATIKDAKERLIKNPGDPNSYIPVKVQTYIAPVSYALHDMLAKPEYEELKGQALRLSSLDKTMQMLATPQIVEEITLSDNLPAPGRWESRNSLEFKVSGERLKANSEGYYQALIREQTKPDEARSIAKDTAFSFSGMAFWPRVILDPAGQISAGSRDVAGEPGKSHWPTVLALMSPTPIPIEADDVLRVSEAVDLNPDILGPAKYSLNGQLIT